MTRTRGSVIANCTAPWALCAIRPTARLAHRLKNQKDQKVPIRHLGSATARTRGFGLKASQWAFSRAWTATRLLATMNLRRAAASAARCHCRVSAIAGICGDLADHHVVLDGEAVGRLLSGVPSFSQMAQNRGRDTVSALGVRPATPTAALLGNAAQDQRKPPETLANANLSSPFPSRCPVTAPAFA